tara:strand:- start:500 stop:754 length:255 start_codon:yes stop_codon:yes gene_type:complete
MAHLNDRHYVIFNCTELDTINFNQVLETSIDTVRKSVDLTQTFVKFEGDTPPSVLSLTTKSQEYSYSEILSILNTPEWIIPDPQ